MFLECIEDNYTVQHVTFPTRNSSVLDLVSTSEPDLVDTVHNLGNFPGSDHSMLSWNISYCSKAHEDSERIAYNMQKATIPVSRLK